MEVVSLAQIRTRIQTGESKDFGPAECYVANYDSIYPHPRKFLYRGCNKEFGNGQKCNRSIEGSNFCSHNPREKGNHTDLYRFQIWLFDARHFGEPLKATIFEAAAKLLQIRPEQFRMATQANQDEFVHNICKEMSLCKVWISVRGGEPIVQKLIRVEQEVALPSRADRALHPNWTPFDSRFGLKELEAHSRGEDSSSSSVVTPSISLQAATSSNFPDLTEVNRKLDEVHKLLANISISEPRDL